MVNILAIEFWPSSHLGDIARTFDARGAGTFYLRPEEGDCLPEEVGNWDGLAMLGGPQHAGDDAGYPYLADATRLARAFHKAGRPVLGVCLGSQILARALGARVRRQGWTEVGSPSLNRHRLEMTIPCCLESARSGSWSTMRTASTFRRAPHFS